MELDSGTGVPPGARPPGPSDASFYVTGGTLHPDAPSYVERRADRDLLEGLLRGEFCYVLTSRQMGKSSLMVRTAMKLREQGTHVAVLDLTAIGQNLTPEQWYDGLMVRMARQLRLEDALESFWNSSPRLGPALRFFSAIRDVVLPNRPGSLSIFVDELDVVRSLPFSIDEFFAAIRECYTRRAVDPEFNRLTFCLLGVVMPNALIRDTRITPFNIGRRIELNDFTPEEAAPLAQGLQNSNSRPDEARWIIARILQWTGGHPYLTQRLCQAVARDSPVQSVARVDDVCEELFLSHRAQERDDNLLFVRERLLRSEADLAGLLDLYSQVLRGRPIADEEANPFVSVLSLSGITRVREGSLRVRNRIYQQVFDQAWVRAHMPDAELRRQRMAFRKGWLRATAVSAVILAAICALAILAVQQARLAKKSLWESYLATARAGRWSGRSGQRFDGLTALAKAAAIRPSPELRNEAIACLALTDLRLSRRWEAYPKGTTAWVADSELRQYARGDQQGSISIRQVSTDQELVRLPGAGLPAEQLLFSPDRKLLAAQYRSESRVELDVWDLARRTISWKWPEGAKGRALAFSRDSRWLAIGLPQGTVVVLDVAAGSEVKRFAPGSAPNAIEFHPQGELLAVSSRESTVVEIWDLNSGLITKRLSHRGPVNDIAWDPDGLLLAVACQDFDIYVWEASKESVPILLKGHEAEPVHLAFTHGGNLLASAGLDETVRLWHPATGKRLATLSAEIAEAGLRFSKDDQQLGCSVKGTQAGIFEVAAGRECGVLHGHVGLIGPTHLDINPDNRLMASAGDDGIQLWDLALGKKAGFLPVGTTASVFFQSGPSDFDLIASDIAGLHRWRMHRGVRPGTNGARLGPAEAFALPAGLGRACQSLDGRFLAVIHTNHVHVIGPNDLDRVLGLDGQSDLARLALSARGQWLAAAPASPGPIRIWNVQTRKLVFELKITNTAQVAFSPNDGWLVTGTSQEYRFWKLSTWEPGLVIARAPDLDQPGLMAFARDGTLMAAAVSRTLVQLIDTKSGNALATLEPPDLRRLSWLCFSPGGRILAAGTENHLIHVWDLPRIREQLASIGLDWESTPYASSGQLTAATPLSIEVEMGKVERSRASDNVQPADDSARLANYTREIENNPGNFEAYHQRAHLFQKLGRLEESLRDFNTVIAARKEAKLYLDRATVLADLDRFDEALQDCARSLELSPTNAGAHELRAKLYLQRQEYEKAEADLEKWVELSPGNVDTLHERGHVFEQMGQFQKAIADFSQALQAHDSRPDFNTHLLVARAGNYVLLGEPAKAWADLQGLSETETANPEVCEALAEFYLRAPEPWRDANKALAFAEKAEQIMPNQPAFLSMLSLAQYRHGQFHDAVRTLENAVHGDESRFEAWDWFVLAMSHHQLGEAGVAQHCFDRGVEWLKANRLLSPKFTRLANDLRIEAETALRIKESKSLH